MEFDPVTSTWVAELLFENDWTLQQKTLGNPNQCDRDAIATFSVIVYVNRS